MPDFGTFFTTKDWSVSGSHGSRQDQEIWYRKDLKELFIQLDGEAISMMGKDGPTMRPQGQEMVEKSWSKTMVLEDIRAKLASKEKPADPLELIGMICDVLED